MGSDKMGSARMVNIQGGSEEDPLYPHKGEPEERERTASLLSSAFNLTNAVLGAGILAFPSAYEASGVVTGALLTALVAGVAGCTLFVLCHCVQKSGHDCRSLQMALRVIVGPAVSRAAEVCLVVFLFGVCVAYLDVISDSVIPVIKNIRGSEHTDIPWWMHRTFIVPVASIILVCPLLPFKNINFLGYTSGIAVTCICYLASYTTVAGLHRHSTGVDKTEVIYGIRMAPKLLTALPSIIFAFQCHVVCIPVYAELKDPSPRRMTKVIIATMLTCLAVYIPTGIFGYIGWSDILWKDGRPQELLKVLPKTSFWANLCHILTAIIACFSFPVMNFTARLTLSSLIFGKDPTELPQKTFAIMTATWFVCVLTVALALTNVDFVIGLVGASACVLMMFIFPGLILWNTYDPGDRQRIVAVVILVAGFIIGVVALTVTILNQVDPTILT